MKRKTLLVLLAFAVLLGVGVSEASAAKTPFRCPDGYTCIPNVASNSVASLKILGQPRLQLAYDSQRKESLLTASFKVSVQSGNKPIYISEYPGIYFRDAQGNYAWSNSLRSKILAGNNVSSVTNDWGQQLFYVPANKKVNLDIVATIDPNSMFAGSYYASLSYLGIKFDKSGASSFMAVEFEPNQTNSQTIIGETGPYISSVTNPFVVDMNNYFGIYGQRFDAQTAKVFIDGSELTAASVAEKPGILSIPVSGLSEGWHSVYVVTSGGQSNVVWFEAMKIANAVKVLTPIQDEVVATWKPYKIEWVTYPTNFKSPTFSISIASSYGKDMIVDGLTPEQTYCDSQANIAYCAYTWTPNYSANNAKIYVSVNGGQAMGQSGTFSISSSTPVVVCPVGYICKPGDPLVGGPTPVQPSGCPVGYVCYKAPATPTSVNQTMTVWDAIMAVYGPLLGL